MNGLTMCYMLCVNTEFNITCWILRLSRQYCMNADVFRDFESYNFSRVCRKSEMSDHCCVTIDGYDISLYLDSFLQVEEQ